MALLGQSRGSWPSMAFLGRHVKLTKMQKLLGSKHKNQTEYEKQNETKMKIHFSFQFCFCFHFAFHFRFCFHFCFRFCFLFSFVFSVFIFVFILVFAFIFLFVFVLVFVCFCFIFYFLVLNFTMALLGHHTPVLRSFKNTYFEQQLWTAASENQHLSDKFRSSRPEVFCKKAVLRNSQNSKENACARFSF